MDDIRKQIVKSNILVINRIPPKTFDQFKQLADEEFCSDYGMTLKHLIDFYFGLIPSGLEVTQIQIEELKKKIEEIESKLNEKKPEEQQKRKMLG